MNKDKIEIYEEQAEYHELNAEKFREKMKELEQPEQVKCKEWFVDSDDICWERRDTAQSYSNKDFTPIRVIEPLSYDVIRKNLGQHCGFSESACFLQVMKDLKRLGMIKREEEE